MSFDPEFIADVDKRNEESVVNFEELLEVVIDTCLRDPNTYTRHLERIRTDSTERYLGIWGLRSQLDLIFNEAFYPSSQDSPSLYKKLGERPEGYMPNANPDVQERIEAFGMSILDDSFESLGDDALEQVIKFRDAKDVNEQYDVITWLRRRIKNIDSLASQYDEQLDADVADVVTVPYDGTVDMEALGESIVVDLSNGDEAPESLLYEGHFYHPARLSPKLVGIYPELNGVVPTCLGYSILAASFFNKVGSEHMHAGVMRTPMESLRLCQVRMAKILHGALREEDVGIAQLADERLTDIVHDYSSRINTANQFHAVVIARLMNGYWVQIDPNNADLINGNSIRNEILDFHYSALERSGTLSRGIELSFFDLDSAIGMPLGVMLQKQVEHILSYDEVANILSDCEDSDDFVESLCSYIEENFCEVLYSNKASYNIDFLIDNFMFESGISKYEYISSVARKIFNDYIFSDWCDEGEDAIRSRLINDRSYRDRRIDDMRAAPMYMTMFFATDGLNLHMDKARKSGMNYTHPSVELGLSAYRVGAAVLSDFALYTDADIPFSFWASNWTSYVTLGNHMPPETDRNQRKLIGALHEAVDRSHLAYYSSRRIIQKFLEQERRYQDGQEQVGEGDS